MPWTKALSVVGPIGKSIQVGSGAPSASVGNNGDIYLDTTTSGGPFLYGAKASGAWPTTSTTLLGATGQTGTAGTQILYGTTQPGPPTFAGLNIGDFFFRTDTFNFYQFQRISGSVGLALLCNLQGSQGLQGVTGVSLQNGSGAPSSSVGNVGDAFLDITNSRIYGPKTSTGWPTSFVSLVGLTGASGGVIQTGTGAPASSLGNVGDVYIDLTVNAVTLYGNKTTSGWPSSGTSLVGTAGLSVLTGSGAPSSSLGAQAQAYVDTTNAVLYVKGASTWSAGTSIVGLQGIQGLSVLTGSGPPASSIGTTGQAYLDYTNSIIYVKTSSGWPSTGTSLLGQTGPASASISSGSGAPTSAPVAGSYYIRTDTTPNYLYGPYTTANGWPTTYVSMGGGSFQTSVGPPASTLGAIGDIAVDTMYGFFYPPKTSSGWTATPISIIGPTGASVQAQPLLGSLATGAGPAAYANGLSAASTPAVMTLAGTTLPAYFVPASASYFLQATIVNASNSSGSITVQLYDTVAQQIIYTSPSYGTGTINTVGFFAPTASPNYPLTANNPLVWRVVGAATCYVAVQPSYSYPSSTGIGVSTQPCFALGSTALSTTAAYLLIPGSTVLTGYWTSPKAAYFNGAQFQISGPASVTCQFLLYSGSTVVYTSPVITAANSPYSTGPLGLNGAVMPAATTLSWRVTGSGTATAIAVNWTAIQ
jgi:hypothetical protein